MAVTLKIPITKPVPKSQDGIPNTTEHVIRRRVRLPPDVKIAEKKAKKEAQAAKKAANAERKRLVVELDPSLFENLKKAAANRDVYVKDLVIDLIKECIGRAN